MFQTGYPTSEPVALSLTDIVHAHTDDGNMCILMDPVAIRGASRSADRVRYARDAWMRAAVHQTQLAESIKMSRG